ncbi:MAG TPA: hypothetical protein VLK84_21430 [Longimicrobium sp.]|nr:hypothetical protein [Longimicrobium sp.]
MYRSCIFCSANLGSNQSLEHFPVGRSLAFDAAKGRLWAVCPRCARWNLAPLEERWEAIEAGERLFRDARVRAQRENVGLARLADGTRLISVGKALAGEMAVVRYGRAYRARHAAYTAAAVGLGTVSTMGAIIMAPVAIGLGSMVAMAGVGLTFAYFAHPDEVADGMDLSARLLRRLDIRPVRESLPGDGGERIRLTRADLRHARLARADDGTVAVHIPALDRRLEGWRARSLIARRLIHLNRTGGDARDLAASVRMIESLGGADACLDRAAATGQEIGFGARYHGVQGLALEMALHEATERRALEGELSMLEAMWREAEQIAAIADRLPDALPPADPPRI